MHPSQENLLVIGRAVVYYASSLHASGAEIEYVTVMLSVVRIQGDCNGTLHLHSS